MTIRELRQVLTEVDNQDMKIKELRYILFEADNQDEEIKCADILKLTYGR